MTARIGRIIGALIVVASAALAVVLTYVAPRLGLGALLLWGISVLVAAILAERYLTAWERRRARDRYVEIDILPRITWGETDGRFGAGWGWIDDQTLTPTAPPTQDRSAAGTRATLQLDTWQRALMEALQTERFLTSFDPRSRPRFETRVSPHYSVSEDGKSIRGHAHIFAIVDEVAGFYPRFDRRRPWTTPADPDPILDAASRRRGLYLDTSIPSTDPRWQAVARHVRSTS